jgi:hypothetical protein
MGVEQDRRLPPEAALGVWYGRIGLKLGWTSTNAGPGAKRCGESGPGGWKAAKPLPPQPGAAAGFYMTRISSRNPVIPAVANELVLFDFDDGQLDELAHRWGLEQLLPPDAWRVRTVDGTHLYTSAPAGRPGMKVEVTPARVTVSVDGYLLAPGGRHPDGLVYELANVDIRNGNSRPPIASVELYERVLELGGQGRERIAETVDSGEPIEVGDRHLALRHLAGRLRGEGLGRKAIEAALEELADRFAEPLENRRELRQVVDWIMRKPAPAPLDRADVELLGLLEELAPAPAAAQRQVGRASWEQPVPFGVTLPVPSFPLETLPDWQREWAVAIAREKGASVDLAATLSLGVVAGALARHVVVMPRPGWTEPLNLYLATALDPGQRKTPMFKAAFRPVRALERRRIIEWDAQSSLTRISAAILDKRRREVIAEAAEDVELTPELLRERVAALTEGLGEIEASPQPRLLTEDVTPEGLASLLADHGRIIAASDEGAILFENFSGRYTQGSANWDLLNKAHSAGDLVVDRKSSGTVFVWDPALTLVLATQPRVLRDLWGKPGAEARGVLARPLYALPDPVYGTGRTPAADVDVLAEYERRVRSLYEDVPLLMLDEDERPLPLTLRLDPDAEAVFEDYELELANERMRLGTSEDAEGEAAYLGWLGKFAGQTARLAACLHAARHWSRGVTTNTTVDSATIAGAIELARYFHAHALVVLGLMGELPEQRRAATVLGWLRARSPEELETLTVRDVHRTRGKGTTAAQARTALRLLEEHGYVRIEKQTRAGRGGRASERIHVHPELQDLGVRPDKPDAGSAVVSSVSSVGSDAKEMVSPEGVAHRDPACRERRAWRARDGVWRCLNCQPPAFPGELVEERP